MTQLITNSNQLIVPGVRLGNGAVIDMRVDPRELWVDEAGYARLISMRLDDGRIGNFYLLPGNSTKNQIINFVNEFITPVGLMLASGQIIKGSKPVQNVSRFLFEALGSKIIHHYLEKIKDPEWAYYEITTQELVITHPIQLRLTS